MVRSKKSENDSTFGQKNLSGTGRVQTWFEDNQKPVNSLFGKGKKMPSAVATATPFGFGPVSKLLSTVSHLPADWDVRLLLSDCAFDFASNARPMNSVLMKATARTFDEVDGDVAISVMSPSFARKTMHRGIPTAFIDSLLWLWRKPKETALDAQVYIAQSSPIVPNNMRALNPVNLIEVGLILPEFKQQDAFVGSGSVVSVGGVASPVYSRSASETWAKIINETRFALQSAGANIRSIIGNVEALPLEARVLDCVSTVSLMSSYDACFEYSCADMVISPPGLTTISELLALQIPYFPLPSRNFSQYIISNRLLELGLRPDGVDWIDHVPKISDPANEIVAVAKLERAMLGFFRSGGVRDLTNAIEEAIKRENFAKFATAQKAFYPLLNFSGAREAAQLIEGLIT